MTRHSRLASAPFLALVLWFSAEQAGGVTLSWSPVGDINNANSPNPIAGNGFGSVSYKYSIGTYEITANQYVEFLNARDPTGANTLGLYNSSMSNATLGGIDSLPGNPDGSKYAVIAGRGNHPVNYVTWYDAVRFANWINNGALSTSGTETGSYTLLGGTATPSNANSIIRNPGGVVFLPNDNEWTKAGYYNPATTSYFTRPTSSSTDPTASGPTATANSANYNGAVGTLTDVGAYAGTTSPYGAFDMGGNVTEWTERFVTSPVPGGRMFYGGSYAANASFMAISTVLPSPGTTISAGFGFRLAMVPEPSGIILSTLALGVLAGVAWRRTKRQTLARSSNA